MPDDVGWDLALLVHTTYYMYTHLSVIAGFPRLPYQFAAVCGMFNGLELVSYSDIAVERSLPSVRCHIACD